jgi:hypothetical protein
MRCYECGIEPLAVHEIMSLESAEPIRIVQWPDGDHLHAEDPPAPEQLEDAAYALLNRRHAG